MAGVTTLLVWYTTATTFAIGMFLWQVFKRQQLSKKAALKPVPIHRRQK